MTKTQVDADIAVLGAGIIGSSCAFQLAKAGFRVALVDPAQPAAGSSGACDGYVSVSTKVPGITMALAAESKAIYPEVVTELGADVEFERAGGMLIVEDAADLAKIEAHVAAVRGCGVDIRMIDRTEMGALEPCLSPALAGGTVCTEEYKISPYLMTFAFARAAVAHGARCVWNERPVAVDYEAGIIRAVETTTRIVRAEQFVFAAGVWSEALGRLAGVDLPVVPRRGELVVTDRIADAPKRFLVSAKYLTAKADPDAARTSSDPLVRLGHGFVLESTASGQCVLGSTRTFSGFDRASSFEGIRAIVNEAVKRVPRLKGAQILRSFAGLRPFVPDKKPIIGRSGRRANLIVAAGHEGDGITMAPITGVLVADMARGRTPRIDISTLSPDRFAAAA